MSCPYGVRLATRETLSPPPPSLVHPSLRYPSIPALVISKGDKEERDTERGPSPVAPPVPLLGGLDHTEYQWTGLGTCDAAARRAPQAIEPHWWVEPWN